MFNKRTCHLKRGLLILSKKIFFFKILEKSILIGHNPLGSSYRLSVNWDKYKVSYGKYSSYHKIVSGYC